MNLTKECPRISDHWKGSISDVARVLGEGDKSLSRFTIRRYIKLGILKATLDVQQRYRISGKEVKRLWRIL